MRQSRIVSAVAALALGLTAASANAAATSSDLLKCQKTIEKGVRSVAGQTIGQLTSCSTKVVNCKLSGELDAEDTGSCLDSAEKGCQGASAKVQNAQSKSVAKAVTACGLIPFAELQQYVAGLGFFNAVGVCSAANVNDLMECIYDDARCSAESQTFVIDPRAQDSLATYGLAATFPCVAP